MSRTTLFRQFSRAIRKAELFESMGISTRSGLEFSEEVSRRKVLKSAAWAAGNLTLGSLAPAKNAPAPRIAIVGAGLAGLTCADRLRTKGYAARIYEASSRVGGRSYSLRGFFPGQVAELGGEFIDTSHKTMLGYANEFNLAVEDVDKAPGDPAYYVLGQHYSEEEVVDQYRALVPRMQDDLRTLSNSPTFFSHTQADVSLDGVDLNTYLQTRAADLPIIRTVADVAYVAEYGLETRDQSCLNFLLFIHSDHRSKFTPFGVFSDERYHVIAGNDSIAQNIAARVGPIDFGLKLTRLAKNGIGEYVLTFSNGETRKADAVVITIPFTVLRDVFLDPSLGLSSDKKRAIAQMGYGNNAKTMLGFTGKPWLDLGGNGEAFTDLPNAQNTWETSPQTAGSTSILTDYAGGDRGLHLADKPLGARVSQFLSSMDVVFPGISGRYTGQAQRMHWPSFPLTKGSYTCYKPGQFTSIAGLEGQAAGRLKFAGEHTDSFYSYQGFMEGACLSGIRAANEILADIRSGAL